MLVGWRVSFEAEHIQSWVTLTMRRTLGFFSISSSSGVRPRAVLNFLAGVAGLLDW